MPHPPFASKQASIKPNSLKIENNNNKTEITGKFFLIRKLLTTNRSQKSPKSGLSIAFKLSFVAASTLTYN